MSRYKGQSKKSAIDAADLREVADCYRRVTRKLLSRAEAGERGAPYRDLMPRA